ncbi:MAG TPA: hypothetical protein VFK69_09565 [Candidatus Eisenbacteria bacterium]|nr:hypothetical protein [Candidatus Eisenbacteria bacterium]
MRGRWAVAAVLAVMACAGVAPAIAREQYVIREDDSRRSFGWLLVTGDQNSASMDLDDVQRIEDRYHGEYLYVDMDGERWLIRDRRTLDQAQRAIEPLREFGRQAREMARGAREWARAYSDDREAERSARAMARLQARIETRERLLERRSARISGERDLDDRAGDASRADLEQELERARAELARAREELRRLDDGRDLERGDDDRARGDLDARKAQLKAQKERFKAQKDQLKSQRREMLQGIDRQLEDLARDAIRHDRAERVE